jgi:hypothetical protein
MAKVLHLLSAGLMALLMIVLLLTFAAPHTYSVKCGAEQGACQEVISYGWFWVTSGGDR